MRASLRTTVSTADALQTWRRQVGRPERRSARRAVRPFAIFSYLLRRRLRASQRTKLRNLTLVALFDEQLPSGRIATRLVGVGGKLGPEGLEFGGPELTRFDKDLRMPPVVGGPGRRFDLARGSLLAFALQLDRYLGRCARYPFYPRRQLPRLPAVLPAEAGRSLEVDLAAVCKRQVVSIASPQDLIGVSGSTWFDFVRTRFS